MRTQPGRRAASSRSAPVPAYHAKLRAPCVSEHYVRRPRLLHLLDSAVTVPLTLVCAPAGAGKTTLAAGWTREADLPTAWVTLDSTDRDIRQFWTSVISALETLRPGCGKTATAELKRHVRVDVAIGHLLDDLESDDQATALLVLDDLQLVDDDRAIIASLAEFAQHLPSWLHLVVLSRREPELPRDRLRARGQLGEVRYAELRFSPDEARELVSRLASPLTADDMEAATVRADGWAAALQLAALAARSGGEHNAPGADGDELIIQDYMLREAFAAEAPELIDALSRVAVVERVNAGLADALTDRPDAGALLEEAERRGLFVMRLDAEGWFAIHALARRALLAALRARAPEQLAEQHVRAARWYEKTGDVPLALEQWLHAGRPHEALRLLAAESTNLYDSGREATIRRTIDAITPGLVTNDLRSMIDLAICHILLDRRRFFEIVDEATWLAAAEPPDQELLARLIMLQSMVAMIGGAWNDAGALARRCMATLGDAAWRDPLGRFGWNTIAREIALSERWDDAGDDVREARLALGRDPRRRVAFEGTRAVGHALAGRPVDALRVAAGMRTAATVSNMSILRAELALAEAMAHREIGDRPRAVAELAELAEAPAEAALYCKIRAGLELAETHQDEGDLEAALTAFAQAEYLADTEGFGPDGRDWVTRVGSQLALASGDVETAQERAQRVKDPFWRGVSVARVELRRGDRGAARAALDLLEPRCVRHDVVLGLLIARSLDDRVEAVDVAAVAVERAASAGMLQTVASEGVEVLELVERAAWAAPPSWMDRLRRAAGSSGSRPGGRGDLIEPLTDREREVLRFLPGRLTVREIADELYISVNTLKFHLKLIYRKLGVSTRAEAAEAARHLADVRPATPPGRAPVASRTPRR